MQSESAGKRRHGMAENFSRPQERSWQPVQAVMPAKRYCTLRQAHATNLQMLIRIAADGLSNRRARSTKGICCWTQTPE
jgi:hypothetical protein